MSIIVKYTKSDYALAPEGLWPAVCCDVVDLGMEQTPWGEQHKVDIRWQLDQRNPENDGKPFQVSERFRLSLHEKSKLRPTLEAWRGRKFTDLELEAFDLEKLIGANCQVQIIHQPREGGGMWAKVQAVVPPARGAARLRVDSDYVRIAERAHRAELEKNPNGYEATDNDVPF